MRIGIVLIAVVGILAVRFLRRELFEPGFEIRVQPRLVVVDEHGSRDVHRVAEQQPFADAGLLERGFDLRRDVDELPALRQRERKLPAVRFHRFLLYRTLLQRPDNVAHFFDAVKAPPGCNHIFGRYLIENMYATGIVKEG